MLKTWFYLVCFTLFSDVTFFCFLGVNMGWMLHLLHQFVPDLYSVTLSLPTSSNTAYSLSGIGSFDKILPCPHEDGQEQRLSSACIKFLWLRQIHDPSDPVSTLYRPSWAAFHNTFFLSAFSLPLYTFFRWSRSVTTTVNKLKRRQAFACRLFIRNKLNEYIRVKLNEYIRI